MHVYIYAHTDGQSVSSWRSAHTTHSHENTPKERTFPEHCTSNTQFIQKGNGKGRK